MPGEESLEAVLQDLERPEDGTFQTSKTVFLFLFLFIILIINVSAGHIKLLLWFHFILVPLRHSISL